VARGLDAVKALDRWLGWMKRPTVTGRIDSPLRIGLVSDELTRTCLERECQVLDLTPSNHRRALQSERPHLVFVESAWSGHRNAWKYRIAAYPDHPERSNVDLARLVATARELGIPAVFWNKEDGVHFDRFVASARLFDHVFTVDSTCVPRYRAVMPQAKTIEPLLFAVQPSVHHFAGIDPRLPRANFVGSYSRHIHDQRRSLQDMLFASAGRSLGLTVFDRNSDRRSEHYRYPDLPGLEVKPAVPHHATARLYRDYLVSLNVNTVVDSPTMFSRRLVEILGCGSLAVTTPAASVDALFAGFCHVVHDEAQADALFGRLKRDGLSAADRDMMTAAAEHVAAHHTWKQRLAQVCERVGVSV
jgi:Glycosyl transferases group 1